MSEESPAPPLRSSGPTEPLAVTMFSGNVDWPCNCFSSRWSFACLFIALGDSGTPDCGVVGWEPPLEVLRGIAVVRSVCASLHQAAEPKLRKRRAAWRGRSQLSAKEGDCHRRFKGL